MSEHQHEWEAVPSFVYSQQEQCPICDEYRTTVKGIGTRIETGPVLGGHDVVVEELEQQLAQAREEIEHLKGFVSESQLTNQRLREHGTTEAQHLRMELRLQERVREGLQAENAQARALLELLTSDDAEPILSDVNGYTCIICDTRVDDYEIEHFPHAPECFWLKARAFLAEHPQ